MNTQIAQKCSIQVLYILQRSHYFAILGGILWILMLAFFLNYAVAQLPDA